jgi:hypothetical protein
VAVEFLPRFEFIRLSLRSLGVPYGVAVSGSLLISALRLFIQPFFYGNLDNYRGPWPNISEYTYYVGLIPIGLVVIFIILRVLTLLGILLRSHLKFLRKFSVLPAKSLASSLASPVFINNVNGEVWFFILIIPIFILISLGNSINPSLFGILWKYTPLYQSIRFPVRHLFVVVFALSATGGIIFGGIKDKLIKIVILIVIVIDLISFDKNFIN